LIILSVAWGGSFFFAEIALRELEPLTIVYGRVSLAAIALVTYVYFSGNRMPTDVGSFLLWAP
jgi:drug/metabolite transporter (DMT)-like permease